MNPDQKVFSALTQKRQNQLYALKEFVRAQPYPLLIYQMAKVGSTSVYRSMREAGLYPLHVHHIAEESYRKGMAYYLRHGAPPPIHLYVSQMLRPYLRYTSHRIQVLSLVRDPIARYVSGLYQMADFSDTVTGNVAHTKKQIKEELADPSAMEYTFGWFDRQIKSVLDIDVMAEPFNRERGFGQYSGPRADVLVVKLERLSDLLPTVVSDFVGCALRSIRANVRRRGARGEEYAKVKNTLSLPAAICERIYGHSWVRHFYTPEEVGAFRSKWE